MTKSRTQPSPRRGAGTPSPAAPLQRSVGAITRWAFFVFMATLPFDVVVPQWLPEVLQSRLSIPRVAGILLLGCCVLDPTLRPWKIPKVTYGFAAFIVVFFFRMFGEDLAHSVQLVQMLVLFVICYNLFMAGTITGKALLVYSVSCGAVVLMVLSGQTVDVEAAGEMGGRYSAFGMDPNHYAEMLGFALLFVIGITHIRKARSVLGLPVMWPLAILLLFGIARSGSRGTSLGVMVGLAALVLRQGSILVRAGGLALVSMIGLITIWQFSKSEVLVERWTTSIETGSTSSRREIAEVALPMIWERPVLGWGPDAKTEVGVRMGLPRIMAAHNAYLQILLFVGLAGAIPYYWSYFTVVRAAWLARRGVEDILPFAVFTAMLVFDLACGGLPGKFHWTIFAYQLAAGHLVARSARNHNARPRPVAGATLRLRPSSG
ncbi:MAG: O-antigen ligase family protein [Thermoguttaceae bacterium]